MGNREYLIFGELPDDDKKLIFTCSLHFICPCCRCDDWAILGFCWLYVK